MSTLMEELTAIKAVEDKLTANKVANFAYTDHAYNNPLTEADGVASYDPDAEQNIPNANASTLQVNSTVLTKGWRAQASSITRMLMNHFLGRCSYNLNKINDLFSDFLGKLITFIGKPNGLATLGENGLVPKAQIGTVVRNINGESPNGDGEINIILGDNMPVTRALFGAVFGRFLGKAWYISAETSSVNASGIRAVYANGIWVAGSSGSGIWWSEDGRNWTQGTGIAIGTTIQGEIVYCGGLWFCGVASGGLWYSVDGKIWTQANGISTEATWSGHPIVYANNIWLCNTNIGSYWSEDGSNWTQGTGIGAGANTPVYANGLWVCGGGGQGVWWSEDGKHWTKGTGAGEDNTSGVVSYANGIWLATFIMSIDLCWSEDGKTWTHCNIIHSNLTVYTKPVYAEGIWVCGGVFGTPLWSEDGKAWYSGSGSWQYVYNTTGVKYANGIWIAVYSWTSAVSDEGIWYSKDGKNWTQAFSGRVANVDYANGLWVACGLDGIWWSEDGVNWTRVISTAGLTRNFPSYGNGTWVCNSDNGIYHSSIEDIVADKTIEPGDNIPLIS